MHITPELLLLSPLCWALIHWLPTPTCAFSRGAGNASCVNMKPGHIRAQPQDPSRRYVSLSADAVSYLPGDKLAVAVRSTRDFMGFLLQARTLVDERPAGSFVLVPPGSRVLTCAEEGDTVTHADKLLKRNLSFVWKAPEGPVGDIRFLITVVQSYFVYWAGIQSAVVHDASVADANADGLSTHGGTWATSELDVDIITPNPEGYSKVSIGQVGHDDEMGLASSPSPPVLPAQTGVSAPLVLTPDLGPPGGAGISPGSKLDKCHNCEQDREQNAVTQEPVPLQSGPQGGTVEPRHAKHSLLIGPNPEPEDRQHVTPMQMGLWMYPQLRASVPLHHLHSGAMSPVTPPQAQKAVVTRNASLAGNLMPPKEGNGQGEKVPGKVPNMGGTELGVLLCMAAGLGMALVLGLRYLHKQHCRKRSEVSLSENSGIIHVQECGDLVQVRKIRQDSFVLLQAEYSILTPPGN